MPDRLELVVETLSDKAFASLQLLPWKQSMPIDARNVHYERMGGFEAGVFIFSFISPLEFDGLQTPPAAAKTIASLIEAPAAPLSLPVSTLQRIAGNYSGQLKSSLPDGFGECIYQDACAYMGFWESGKFHGGGKFTFADGRELIATFDHGVPCGKATEVAPNGLRTCTGIEQGSTVDWSKYQRATR